MPRRRKRRKKNKRKISRLIFFIILCFSLSYFSLRYFSNYQIKVVNGETYLNAQISDIQNIVKNIPYFLIHKDKIKNEILSNFPIISDISLKFIFPREITFQVKEREPYIIICLLNENNCFLCDKEGVVFLKVEDKEKYKNLISVLYNSSNNFGLGTKILEQNIIEEIIEINNYLSSQLKISISNSYLSDDLILTLTTNENWKVFFDLNENVKLQLIKLKLVLEQGISEKERKNLEYIDLRFKKVYVK